MASEPLPDGDPPPRFTYGDYRQWDDGARWELMEGRPYAMAPAPGVAHQRLVSELGAQLVAQLRGSSCEPLVAPVDVRLPRAAEADDDVVDVVQPDVMVVCDPAKLDERGCRGAPDFVIEVSSRSTAARDRVTKLGLYERHGVREYWLVQPDERVVTIYRRATKGGFDRPVAHPATGVLSSTSLPAVRIDWDQAFARIHRR